MADYNYGGGYAYQDEGTGTADDVYYAYADDYANQEENSGEHAGTLNKAFNTAANKAFNTAASDESWGCCNDAQTNFLLLYFAYCLVAFIVWKTLVATPIETMNRVLHKVNQAFVTWLTGGDLVDDEDEDEEASNNYHASKPHVTGTPVRGESDRRAPLVVGTPLRIKDAINRGCGCLVIPAGYIGTSFWAFFLVVMAGGRQTATSTAGILTAILLVTLYRVPEPNVAAVTMAHVATIALITYIGKQKQKVPLSLWCSFQTFLTIFSLSQSGFGTRLYCNTSFCFMGSALLYSCLRVFQQILIPGNQKKFVPVTHTNIGRRVGVVAYQSSLPLIGFSGPLSYSRLRYGLRWQKCRMNAKVPDGLVAQFPVRGLLTLGMVSTSMDSGNKVFFQMSRTQLFRGKTPISIVPASEECFH